MFARTARVTAVGGLDASLPYGFGAEVAGTEDEVAGDDREYHEHDASLKAPGQTANIDHTVTLRSLARGHNARKDDLCPPAYPPRG